MAIASKGAKIQRSTDGGTSWTDFCEVTGVSGLSISADTIETTNFKTSTNYKEYIIGMLDAGEISFDANFVYSDVNSLIGFMESGSVEQFQIVFPDASTFTFNALVTNVEINASVGDKVNMS